MTGDARGAETSPRTPIRLDGLASRFGLDLRGDPGREISGVGTLAGAGEHDITFLSNPAYRRQLGATGAGAVILSADDAADCPTACLVARDPYVAWARVAALFDPRSPEPPGVHPSAVVDPSATLGDRVAVGPNAVVGAGTVLRDGCCVGAGSVVGAGCTLGEGARLVANVTIGDGVRLGRRVLVHPGAVIGADGFGLAFEEGHWIKVPQLGGVVIGDDCEIGANTTIDRGAIEDTVLEEDVRIDNLVQIGHNVHIGAHSALAGCVGISGSTRIGKYCMLAGRSGCAGHLELADRTTVLAASVVTRSITEPGTTVSNNIPAQPVTSWNRQLAGLRRLDGLRRRVSELEKRLKKNDDDD